MELIYYALFYQQYLNKIDSSEINEQPWLFVLELRIFLI